jgi:hypothetical protein
VSAVYVDDYARVEGRTTVACRYTDRLLIALWPWTRCGSVAPGADLRVILDEAEPRALARCALDPVGVVARACRGVDLVVRELAPPRVEGCRWPGIRDADVVASRIAAMLREAPPITPANVAATHADLSERHARFPMHAGIDHEALRALGWLRAAAAADTSEAWEAAIERCAIECAGVAVSHACIAPGYGDATWEPVARLLWTVTT